MTLPETTPPSPDSSETPPHKKSGATKWLLLVLLLCAGGWAYTHKSETSPTAEGQPAGMAKRGPGGAGAVSVQTTKIEKGSIAVTLDALGTVTPLATVAVRPQISGQLVEVAFQEGQLVQKGDFLAQIDPRAFENALHQAEGQLLKDEAQLKDARLNLERYKKLTGQGSVSEQQRDTQEALVQQLEGVVQTDQAQIESAKLNLTYAHITAPISGRVGLRQVDVGNYVQTSDTSGVVSLTQLQPISVLFTIPQDKLPDVLKEMKEGTTLEVAAYDRTQTTKLASGKLSSVDNQIDTSTGTVKLRALFDNEDSALFPNQFVNAKLTLRSLTDALIVPTGAIQKGTPGTFVYLLKTDNTVTVRPIKTGPSEGEKTAVTEGLQEGDVIVTDGTDKLNEGAKVEVPKTGVSK